MSPPEGHAQGPGAPGPWREPRAGQWRTDASPGSRRRGPQTSPSAAAACACAVRLSGRMVPVSGTWRLCERIRVDPGFRGRGPVCHRCQRLSPLCLVALGDAVHLLWVVLERVSALCDVAKGSRVLPAERCLPCRRREPWPPPPCVREQVLQVAVEQHAVCCCRGPVAAAQPHPGQLCGLPCPSPCPGLADGRLLLRGGRGAEGGRPQCQGHVPLTCAGGRLQPSAFGGRGGAGRHRGCLSVATGGDPSRAVSCSRVPLCPRHSSGTMEPPASLCPLWAAPRRLARPGLVAGPRHSAVG